jgi:hypothetical protein
MMPACRRGGTRSFLSISPARLTSIPDSHSLKSARLTALRSSNGIQRTVASVQRFRLITALDQ